MLHSLLEIMTIIQLGCVIVAKPKGVKLKEETYAECFRCNAHGAGMAYVKDGKLVIDKGFFKFEDFYKAVKEVEDLEMILHFRIKSHGEINFDNCHPFEWESSSFPEFKWAICHNGVLQWRSTPDKSDTRHFIEDLLGPHLSRDPWFLDSGTGMWMLGAVIEPRNKLALLRFNEKTGEIKTYIVNEKQGENAFGCWFSNGSYKIIPVAETNYYGRGYYGSEDQEARFNRALAKYDQDDKPFAYERQLTGDGKNVWVPRMKPVVVVKKKELVVQKEFPGMASMNFSLEYLTKSQKRVLRRLASDYVRDNVPDLKGLTNNAMIWWLRTDARDRVTILKNLCWQEIDTWLVKAVMDSDSGIIPELTTELTFDQADAQEEIMGS